MIEYSVVEASSFDEAENYAESCSIDVIESYAAIEDEINNDYTSWFDEEGIDPDDYPDKADDVWNELERDDIAYEVREVNLFEVASREIPVDEESLDNAFNDDPDEFWRNCTLSR